MDDRDWDILATIATEKTISRAAERLFVSQPALSFRLRAIEEEFKTRAFHRTPKGVSLTPQGEQLVAYAKEMRLALSEARERIASFRGQIAGTLRIGSSGVFARSELPPLLAGFLCRHPRVDVSLVTALSHAVVRLLEREEIAVAVVRGDYPWTEVRHLLREEPVCLVSRRPLELDQLPDAPRIMYETDRSLQGALDAWWRQHFTRPPKVSMVVDRAETCRRMVAQGLGYALLPAMGLDQTCDRGVSRRALLGSDGAPVLRRTWLLCRKGSLELPRVRAFVEYLLEAEAGHGEAARAAPPLPAGMPQAAARAPRAGARPGLLESGGPAPAPARGPRGRSSASRPAEARVTRDAPLRAASAGRVVSA